MSNAYILVHIRLDFFMEANTLSPNQTAPKRANDTSLSGGKNVKTKIKSRFENTAIQDL